MRRSLAHGLPVLILIASFRFGKAAPQPKMAVLEFDVAKSVVIDRIYFSDRVRSILAGHAPNVFMMTRESTEVLLRQYGKSLSAPVQAYEKCARAGACVGEPNEREKQGSGYDGACNWKEDRGNHPMNCLYLREAQRFCEWIGGRLPTNAEWMHAAKGGEGRIYPWGDDPVDDKRANFCDKNCPYDHSKATLLDDRYERTVPVGSYPAGASKWGVLDLAGNVAEWVMGEHRASEYEIGGSWSSRPEQIDTASQGTFVNESGGWSPLIGFRCAM